MKRTLAAAIVTIAVLAFQRSDYAFHPYGVPGHTLNGGVTVGDCYHWNVGYEVWGQPGFFADEC